MSKTINLQERWHPRLINCLFHNYIISEITNNKIIIKTKEIEFILQKCKTEYNNNKSYYDNELANINTNNRYIFIDDNDNTKIKKIYTLLYLIFIQNNINEVKLQYIIYIINIINTENLIDKTMLNNFKIKKSGNYLYYIAGFSIAGLLVIGTGYLFGFKNIRLPLIIKN
jgi:hypothetical protein